MRPFRLSLVLLCASFAALVVAPAAVAAEHDAAAVRLNNEGVAWMNQQQTERAESSFAQAAQKDKTLAEAALNDGIALLYLQKLNESEESLKRSIALSPGSPRGWYNLGLAQRAANDIPAALVS